jgi:FlaA1/EpsC-like NDP-sugar epimerase
LKRRKELFLYGLADFLMAMLAWALFFVYRKKVEGIAINQSIFNDPNFFYGVLIIPIGWLLFYSIFDRYNDIYRYSRLETLSRTFFLSFFGVIFLFFTLILDDFIRTYITSFIILFCLHFFLTALARMVILTRASRRLKSGKVTYDTPW